MIALQKFADQQYSQNVIFVVWKREGEEWGMKDVGVKCVKCIDFWLNQFLWFFKCFLLKEPSLKSNIKKKRMRWRKTIHELHQNNNKRWYVYVSLFFFHSFCQKNCQKCYLAWFMDVYFIRFDTIHNPLCNIFSCWLALGMTIPWWL